MADPNQYVNDMEWEQRKEYLIRRMLGKPPLSTITEETSGSSSRDVISEPPTNLPSPCSSSSSIPSLIIEPEPKVNKHDEPEEFYQQLEIKMRRLYRKLFVEGKSEVDTDLSDSPVGTSTRRESYEEESDSNGNEEISDEMEITESESDGNMDQTREEIHEDEDREDDIVEGDNITDEEDYALIRDDFDTNTNDEQNIEGIDEDVDDNDEMGTDNNNLTYSVTYAIGEELNDDAKDTSLEDYPKSSRDTAVRSASLSSSPDSDAEETSHSGNAEGVILVTFKADVHRSADDEASPKLVESLQVPDQCDASSTTEVLPEIEVMRTPRHHSSGSLPRHALDVSSPDLPDPQPYRPIEAHRPTFSQEPASRQTNRQETSMELTLDEFLDTSPPARADEAGVGKSLVGKGNDEDISGDKGIDEDVDDNDEMGTDNNNLTYSVTYSIGEELNDDAKDTSLEDYPKSSHDTAVRSASLSSSPDSDAEETSHSGNAEGVILVTFKADVHRSADDEASPKLVESLQVPDQCDASSTTEVLPEIEVMRTPRHHSSGSLPRHALDVSSPDLPDPQPYRPIEAHRPTFSQEPASRQTNRQETSMELTLDEFLDTSPPARADEAGVGKSLVGKGNDEDISGDKGIDEDVDDNDEMGTDNNNLTYSVTYSIGEELNDDAKDTSLEDYPKSSHDTAVRSASLSSSPYSDAEETLHSGNAEGVILVTFKADVHRSADDEASPKLVESLQVPDQCDASSATEVLPEIEVMRTPRHHSTGSLPRHALDVSCPDPDPQPYRPIEAHRPTFSQEPASRQTNRQETSMELTLDEFLDTAPPARADEAGVGKSLESKGSDEDISGDISRDISIKSKEGSVNDEDNDKRIEKGSTGSKNESFNLSRKSFTVKGSSNVERYSSGEANSSGGMKRKSSGKKMDSSGEKESGQKVKRRIMEKSSKDKEQPSRDKEIASRDEEQSSGDKEQVSNGLEPTEDETKRSDGEQLGEDEGEFSRDEEHSGGDEEQESNGSEPTEDETECSDREHAERDLSGDEEESTRKRRGATPPISAKRRRYADKGNQTVDFGEMNRRMFRNMLVGTPIVYNLCTCPYHVCHR